MPTRAALLPLLLAAAALLLAPAAGAQAPGEPGHGEHVAVTGTEFPPAIVADRMFYPDVTLANRDDAPRDVAVFTVLYNMTGGAGSPCEGARAEQTISVFAASVHLDPGGVSKLDGQADFWGHKVASAQLDGPGTHELCVWVQNATCPSGPLIGCFLDEADLHVPVRLANAPPALQPRVEPATGTADTTFRFDAGVRDADGDAVQVRWDFGDHRGAAGPGAQHRFPNAGTYRVLVSASDGWDTTNRTLTVQVAQPAGGGAAVPGPGPAPTLAAALLAARVAGARLRPPRRGRAAPGPC